MSGARISSPTIPRKLAYATIGWTVAPYLGVWLYANHGVWPVYALSAAAALLLLAVFWYLRLSATPIIAKGQTRPATPHRLCRPLRSPSPACASPG